MAEIREDMPWNDRIRAVHKSEARAKIQGNTQLNQLCSKEKRSLKISLNIEDYQTDKKALQAKDRASSAEQGSEVEKSSEKARKEKKKKGRQGRRERPNPAVTRANAALATTTNGKRQRKKKKARDISEITYYSCNKKDHYASNCTEPKN